jgi:hypothetical protein
METTTTLNVIRCPFYPFDLAQTIYPIPLSPSNLIAIF